MQQFMQGHALFVEEVEWGAFRPTYNLRRVVISPDVVIKQRAFHRCLSLEVIAASAGFELDTGDKDMYGRNDPHVGISRFAKWRNQMDDYEEYYKVAMGMLELANSPLNGNVGMQATTEDPRRAFLAGRGRDVANLVLSFMFGVEVGEGDLREVKKAKL